MTAYMREKIASTEPIIYKELKNGNSIKDACKVAGLPRSTFYYWEQRVKHEDDAPDEAVNFFAKVRSDNGYEPFDFAVFRKIDASIDGILAAAKEMREDFKNILERRINGYR